MTLDEFIRGFTSEVTVHADCTKHYGKLPASDYSSRLVPSLPAEFSHFDIWRQSIGQQVLRNAWTCDQQNTIITFYMDGVTILRYSSRGAYEADLKERREVSQGTQ